MIGYSSLAVEGLRLPERNKYAGRIRWLELD